MLLILVQSLESGDMNIIIIFDCDVIAFSTEIFALSLAFSSPVGAWSTITIAEVPSCQTRGIAALVPARFGPPRTLSRTRHGAPGVLGDVDVWRHILWSRYFIQWIEGKIYRKPWIVPLNTRLS